VRTRRLARALACVLAGMLVSSPAARAQDPSAAETAELINNLLGTLLGFRDLTGAELQQEVAELGGVPFRKEVPLEYMSRRELAAYLAELMDAEYPESRALTDQRTLVGFDLLSPETDLRALRAKVLEENVAGFYDERPGRKRLYAVSEDERLTPSNQLVLAHELRHALQDQYVDVHATLPAAVGDYDDRRIAFLSLLEGDATLVMERFLIARLGIGGETGTPDLTDLSLPAPPVPGVPPVVRDQLVMPYVAGRDLARAILKARGLEGLRQAWARPPKSTEQVLHPDKYAGDEAPRPVDLSYQPSGATLLNDGVLGELLARTLLEEETEAAASQGWGGDRYRVWDVGGRTLLVWRSLWDTPKDADEFLAAALARFGRRLPSQGRRHGFALFGRDAWSYGLGTHAGGVVLVSSDDAAALERALLWHGR
jgi:hypothetical protein